MEKVTGSSPVGSTISPATPAGFFVSRGFCTEVASHRQYVAVRFPSVVTRGEFNVVINPALADFGRITWRKPEPLFFDARVIADSG